MYDISDHYAQDDQCCISMLRLCLHCNIQNGLEVHTDFYPTTLTTVSCINLMFLTM